MKRGLLTLARATGSHVGPCVIACAASSATLAQPVESDPIPLQVGQTLSATQRADDAVTYAFEAAAGETYLLEVEQQGLDFIVTVVRPDGSARSYNSPLRRDESEFVVLDQTEAMTYRVSVASNELTYALGSHSIRVTEVETEGDRGLRLGAWRLTSEAAAFNAEAERARRELSSNPAGESTEEYVETMKLASRDAYQAALRLWRQVGDVELEAYMLYSLAMIEYWDLSDWMDSAELAAAAAHVYQALNRIELFAGTTFVHAYALVEVARGQQPEQAEPTFARALAGFDDVKGIRERLSDQYGLAELHQFIGYTQHLRGQFADAASAGERSASLFASLGEWRQELNVRQNLAAIDVDEGHVADAIRTYEYIVQQIPEGADPDFEAIVLDNLGAAYRNYGRIDEALTSYSRALALRKRLGDDIHLATSLRGLGLTYYTSGELDRARDYLDQALAVARTTGDLRTQAGILTYLGNIAYLEGDFQTALDVHREAARLTSSHEEVVSRQILVARDLGALGRSADALAEVQAILDSPGITPVAEADALLLAGQSHGRLGKAQTAVRQLERALSIYQGLGLEEREASALRALAATAREQGDWQQAVDYGASAIHRIESLRARVSAPALRAFYVASRRGIYEAQIELLMSLGERNGEADKIRSALDVSERSRARMLVDLLAETSLASGSAAQGTTAGRRSELYEDLAEKQRQRDRLIEVSGGFDRAELEAVRYDMAAIENELTLLETKARTELPADSVFSPAGSLDAAEIQRLLDPSTMLLQYALGDVQSFVWVVTRDSVIGFRLPDRNTIEDSARRAVESLRARQRYAPNLGSPELTELAGHLLKPIAHLLVTERVLVAADGALHYIPFSLLPIELDGTSAPLIRYREVIHVPSMSALVAQRSRARAAAPATSLALFADPVFERTDQRLTQSELVSTQPPTDEGQLATRSSVNGELTRLKGAATEAEFIAGLVPAEGRLFASGVHASRNAVLRTDLTQYRFVHFATHGLVDSRYPALSALALSRFDDSGNEINGFLRLHDIYNLRLNADLVVLSACDTALGREIRGEGLVGLTQGFMSAGAKTLVVSLWRVEDAATAELMKHFYASLIKEKLSPAAALRHAQMSIAAEPRWTHPFFWGAFVVIGDWQ